VNGASTQCRAGAEEIEDEFELEDDHDLGSGECQNGEYFGFDLLLFLVFANRPRRRPRSGIHADKGVSTARRGVNGASTSAVLVPKKSRTSSSSRTITIWGAENVKTANILVLISCSS